MVFNQKTTGRAASMPGGLAFGAAVSVGVTILAASLLAWMLDREILGQNQIGYGIMVLLLLASFLGAMGAFAKIKRQRMLVCLASGILYFGILLSCTALFFGGQYSGVGVTALLITAGAIAAGLLGLRSENRRKNRKFKMPTR